MAWAKQVVSMLALALGALVLLRPLDDVEVEQRLVAGGAALVLYAAQHDDLPRIAFVEQLIAARAATFLYSASSFFSQTIVRERQQRRLGPSVAMHGHEQRQDFEAMREFEAAASDDGNVGALLPGGRRKIPIIHSPPFDGAALVLPKEEL